HHDPIGPCRLLPQDLRTTGPQAVDPNSRSVPRKLNPRPEPPVQVTGHGLHEPRLNERLPTRGGWNDQHGISAARRRWLRRAEEPLKVAIRPSLTQFVLERSSPAEPC